MSAKRAVALPRSLSLNAVNLKDRGQLIRVTLIALIIVMLIATALFTSAARMRENTPQRVASVSRNTSQTLEQFAATWRANVAKTADQITVSWAVRDTRELRASLAAFDAAQPKSPRINVTRREGAFNIAAEVSP